MFWNYFKVMGILLPLSLLSGACFPLATRIIDPQEEDAKGVLIAKAYTWNTAGAVAGSLLAGFFVAPLLITSIPYMWSRFSIASLLFLLT